MPICGKEGCYLLYSGQLTGKGVDPDTLFLVKVLSMSDYFSHARREIAPHLPARIGRFLDVGCGNGTTSAFIRHHHPEVEWAGGVELFADAAEKARSVLDQVWCGDLEQSGFDTEIAPQSLDLILCLDVLEHLVDPWTVVKRLSPLLKPEGRLIISIPNIRNWKFIRKLFFNGDFHYRDAGLLDRTHLRFFVRATAIELAEAGGLKVAHAGNAHPWKPFDMRNILSLASGHGLDDLMIKQFILVASPAKIG
jgi:2-polyprenyl-3-methyl-5-hydroxy-6-metoxy-1,4-benzoquinol methylase